MAQIENPLVSILMATYNRADFLPYSLDSLLAQKYRNIEIIVGDDGSTDRTPDIAKEYAAKDKRVEHFPQPRNGGYAVALTNCLKRARGKYAIWVGDDDRWDETFIESMVEGLEKNGDCVLAVTSFERILDNGVVDVQIIFSDSDNFKNQFDRYKQILSLKNFQNQLAFGLIRTDVFRKILVARPLRECIGWDFLVAFELVLSGKIYFVPQILKHWRNPAKLSPSGNPLKKRKSKWMKKYWVNKPIFFRNQYTYVFVHSLGRLIMSNSIPLKNKALGFFVWLAATWESRNNLKNGIILDLRLFMFSIKKKLNQF